MALLIVPRLAPCFLVGSSVCWRESEERGVFNSIGMWSQGISWSEAISVLVFSVTLVDFLTPIYSF